MNTAKEILDFCNDALIYDYNIGIICDLNRVREFLLNRFRGTIPHTRILSTISIIDDIILKVCNDDDDKNILNDVHNLGKNIVLMFSDEKSIQDEIVNGNTEEYILIIIFVILFVFEVVYYLFSMFVLRGQKNARYNERLQSNKKKSYNFVNFLEEYNTYRAENFNVH